MEELQKKIKEIFSDIEKNLKNEKDAEFAKTKIIELYEAFADELEEIEVSFTDKLDIITAKYSLIDTKLNEVQKVVDRMQKDIYMDQEYDLDIVCPYCDAEFSIDMNDELKNSVICPECENEIELDWNEEDGCGHDCSGCHHDCEHDEEEDEDM